MADDILNQKMNVNHTDLDDNQATDTSLINVNMDGYLKLFNMYNHSNNDSVVSKYILENADEHPFRSSVPLNLHVEEISEQNLSSSRCEH